MSPHKASPLQQRQAEQSAAFPKDDSEFLRVLERRDISVLSALARSVAARLATFFWGSAPPDFLIEVAAHSSRLFDRERFRDVLKYVRTSVQVMRQDRMNWQDAVLDPLLALVEREPTSVEQIVDFRRVFVRDVLIEVILVEAGKYELASLRQKSSATLPPVSRVPIAVHESPALARLDQFIEKKASPYLRNQHLERDQVENLLAEAKAGLFGFGEAAPSWGGRKSLKDFDRALSGLAAFIIKSVRFAAIGGGILPAFHHITLEVLKVLEDEGLPHPHLNSLRQHVGRSWDTFGGLKKAAGLSFTKERRIWLDRIFVRTAVYEARGGGRRDGENGDPLSGAQDTRSTEREPELGDLVDIILDSKQFERFLDKFPGLQPENRKRLKRKFVLVKIAVLRDSVDDLFGACWAPDGSPQLKFVLLKGISAVVFGLAGETGHARPATEPMDGEQQQAVCRAGFSEITSVILSEKTDPDAWDAWRLNYTIGFVSTLWRVDSVMKAALERAVLSSDDSDDACCIQIKWLTENVLRRRKDPEISPASISTLVNQYEARLPQFIDPRNPAVRGEAAMRVEVGSGTIATHLAYPHVLLATYAPYAFATLYWNLHQDEKLTIQQMQDKLRDLRVSLGSLKELSL